MARPKKVSFVDALDVYMQTCSNEDFEGVEYSLRVWKRVRERLAAEPKAETVKVEEKP